MQPGRTLRLYEMGILLVGALIANWMRVGSSPLLWQDTLNDQRLVRLCLDHGHCSFAGAPVSFGHLWQGSAWHQMLTLFDWLGLGISGAHLVMLVLDALVLVLVAIAATRLAGRLAGLVAVLAAMLLTDGTDQFSYMLWNFRPLAFLAALTMVVSLALAASGRLHLALLAAAAAAVNTNVHMVSGVTVAMPLAAALLADGIPSRGRRLALCAATLGCYLAAVFVTSPAAWWHNLKVLFEGGWFPSGAQAGSGAAAGGLDHMLVLAGLAACVLVAFGWALTTPGNRRKLVVLFVGILPLLVFFIAVQSTSSINRTDRYLVPLLPVVAVALGAGASLIVMRLARPTGALHPSRRVDWLRRAMPWATAGCLLLLPAPGAKYAGYPLPTFRQAEQVLATLRDQLAWDSATAFRDLKGPDDYLLLETMHVTGFPMADAVEVPPAHRRNRAYALHVRTRDLPPGNQSQDRFELRPLGSDGPYSMVLVTTPAWLDWSRFQVCTGQWPDLQNCLATGLELPARSVMKPVFAIRRMPDAGRILDQELVLQVPVRPPAGGSDTDTRRQLIWMPWVNDVCAGRVVSVPGETSRILEGGRAAELVAKGPDSFRGDLVLSFRLGSAGCPRHTYRGFPPFVVEASPAAMPVLRKLLQPFARRDGGDH